ncbi:unnamed protein product [Adineta steineri]|uniref:Ubiquitin-like domain-containing protein n=1 Tax=Adineta steineri TaxID=433720 RepID=A0A819TWW2_9BILA|nr:unnamed protein product [Adineta steineri]CAF4079814.1 unnamed protein product [Adineta steineri]
MLSIKFQVYHGGDIYEMILTANSPDPTVEDLQRQIEKQFIIPIKNQRIIFKGQDLHENQQEKLRRYGITNACAIRVIGRKELK